MRNRPLDRISLDRKHKAATAVLTFTLYLAANAHSALGQTSVPAQPTEPTHKVIPVHLDATTGDIQVGRTTYSGANPGLHLLALKRQPDSDQQDTADLIEDQTFTDANSANQFLQNVLANTSDAMVIANGVGNYGVPLKALAMNLELFGAQVDLEQVTNAIPFIFIGNGGRKKGGALQRGFSTVPIDGYLALDSNTNYTFIQTDYVRYDITPDGTVTIGGIAYTAAASFRNGGCDVSNSFRLVIVDRETLKSAVNNSYCTAADDNQINYLEGDLGGVNAESQLVFIFTTGHPIPANWNFGTDGDSRFVSLALEIANLGGYFETIVYLTPTDTYSLVGAPAPPSYVARPRSRARESSSVYPGHPTGELHGVLARGRGNWYSPLNADTSGLANLDFYDKVLAQVSIPAANSTIPNPNYTFPPYPTDQCDPDEPTGQCYPDELKDFTTISTAICNAAKIPDCTNFNPRNNYSDSNIVTNNYLTALGNIKGPNGEDCSQSANSKLAFCMVWQQLSTEFQYVGDIGAFATNLGDLGTIQGVTSLFDIDTAWNTVQATLPTQAPSAPSLVSPIVNLLLGLASAVPSPLAPLFGLADTFFNFGTSLVTDSSGNKTASLATPAANLSTQALANFQSQLDSLGTQFNLIYENWAKMKPLGELLASASPGWTWGTPGTSTAAAISQKMNPIILQSMYQSLMSAVYAIGSYLPNTPFNCSGNGGPNGWPVWGGTPLWQEPNAYAVLDGAFTGCNAGLSPVVQPFNTIIPAYFPYTYPTDAANPYFNDPRTGTLLAYNSWLAISLQSSPSNSGRTGVYNPPDTSLLSTLFTPIKFEGNSNTGGLGVYRPAFFEGWSLPHVTCDPTYGTSSGDGIYVGGCTWNAAAPPLEALPEPVAKVSIVVTRVSNNGAQVNVQLAIHNSGTKDITSIKVSDIALRTLQGAHDAKIVAPALPINIGNLAHGTSTTIFLALDVPRSVNKLQLTESGTAQTGESSPYKFSLGQVIFPKKEK